MSVTRLDAVSPPHAPSLCISYPPPLQLKPISHTSLHQSLAPAGAEHNRWHCMPWYDVTPWTPFEPRLGIGPPLRPTVRPGAVCRDRAAGKPGLGPRGGPLTSADTASAAPAERVSGLVCARVGIFGVCQPHAARSFPTAYSAFNRPTELSDPPCCRAAAAHLPPPQQVICSRARPRCVS